MKIVYDFGAHNGSNIPYYLLKFDKVVAVEANPILISEIEVKFKKEISENRLILINCAVSSINGNANFYIHKDNSVLSQFPTPSDIENFQVIRVESRKASDIVKEFGFPEYIKIDVEHTDVEILQDLFINKIFPMYISAESHDILVFTTLVSSRQYLSYKILDGRSIHDLYQNKNIDGQLYTFPFHSAGPMFEDIDLPELNEEQLFYKLAMQGLGWKDIHAKRFK